MRDTWPRLACSEFPPIERGRITTLQLNLGYRCNLSCIHCHVNAGPRRTETMDRDTMQLALEVGARLGVGILDLTGGSPEMNVDFRWLVETAKARGLHVMDRLNPTIMQEPGYAWVGEFLAAHEVEAIASLPCYSQANVEEQRGEGTFESSITALQRLNALGYAMPDSKLILNLVYNPNGAFLPPAQGQLEREYRHLLGENFGIRFNHLYALANMPIQRFGSWLLSKGKFDDYMATLRNAHQDANLDAVMCRSTLSVGHDGKVYDCDFNQMPSCRWPGARRIPICATCSRRICPGKLVSPAIAFGCTAGQGSSCGGFLH
ncbi:MAG: arsenosugar biosynthesis radical SAM protein ArsS [Xanthomonadales bacterium]|nr:arsenosugar biosynthesis radical SAM protein ArsS [Xanthomonadales bacterium]